ncbi:hypothetical protein [Ensifer sp. 4252]
MIDSIDQFDENYITFSDRLKPPSSLTAAAAAANAPQADANEQGKPK